MNVVYAVLIFVGGALGGCALKDEIARRAGARRARGARACPARRNRAPRDRRWELIAFGCAARFDNRTIERVKEGLR